MAHSLGSRAVSDTGHYWFSFRGGSNTTIVCYYADRSWNQGGRVGCLLYYTLPMLSISRVDEKAS